MAASWQIGRLSSLTVSPLPTPLGWLNGSILSDNPQFLSPLASFLSPSRFPNNPLQSVCLGQREAPWEFNCLIFPWSQVHYINSSGPRCILLTCRNLFLYLLCWQRGSFPLCCGRGSKHAWVREKVKWSSAGKGIHCDAPAEGNMTRSYRRGSQSLLSPGEIRVAAVRMQKYESAKERWGRSEAVLTQSVNITSRGMWKL